MSALSKTLPSPIRWVFPAFLLALPVWGQREMETLDRGMVAIRQEAGKVHVSWRLYGTEPEDTAFNLYRVAGDAPQEWIRACQRPCLISGYRVSHPFLTPGIYARRSRTIRSPSSFDAAGGTRLPAADPSGLTLPNVYYWD